jgi:predicted O-methyltransferase YrrM
MTLRLPRTVGSIVLPLARVVGRARVAMAKRTASADAQRLLDVIDSTLRGATDDDAERHVTRIEALRAELERSREPLAITDYGAGAPSDNRTEEEMRQGVIVHRTVGQMCHRASKPRFWARMLFDLVRAYRPRNGPELGTCLGVSAAYQGAAMSLAGDGALVTLEGADSLATIARQTLDRLGRSNVRIVTGRFEDTLEGVLGELGTLDYAFIDGHHDEKATIAYFERLAPLMAGPRLMVFDDIAWTAGMRRAWRTIVSDPRVIAAVDLSVIGVCLLGERRGPVESFRIALP